MLEEKDQRLYQDLMSVRDTFNNERIARHGFKPDAASVSSILLDQINSKTHTDLSLDKDALESQIEKDQEEIEKIVKITELYRENMARQQKQEQEAIEMLSLQEEELRSLHDESKQMAAELSQERKQLLKAQLDNKKKLQELYHCDEKMRLLKETVETRKD